MKRQSAEAAVQPNVSMANIWNRYKILSEAFEASVQRLGLVDAVLGVVVAAAFAGIGVFLTVTDERIIAAFLLAPLIVAVGWVTNAAGAVAARTQAEIAALISGDDDKEVQASIRSLGDGYSLNRLAYQAKIQALRASATLFLVIVSLAILAPYVGAALVAVTKGKWLNGRHEDAVA